MTDRQTSRHVRILQKLWDKEWTSAKELADVCVVSQRTIYRDIEELLNHGVPIEGVPGPEGGYRIRRPTDLSPDAFRSPEALSEYFQISPDIATRDKATRGGTLGRDVSDESAPGNLLANGKILLNEVSNKIEPSSFGLLQASLGRDEAVCILVDEDKDTCVTTVVKPYGLVWSDCEWHLVCADVADQILSIWLGDITSVKRTGLKFVYPMDFNLADWWKERSTDNANDDAASANG